MRRRYVFLGGFIGVILGIALAAMTDVDTVRGAVFATLVTGGIGALVGSRWSPSSNYRRDRATSR